NALGTPGTGPINGFEACVFTFGICQGGGAGKVLAEWVTEGETEWDMWSCDPRRFTDYCDQDYCNQKGMEVYGNEYAMHFPHHEWSAARDKKLSPNHEKVLALGGVMGAYNGWERANWFARNGQDPAYDYSWKRQNFFDNVADELKAVRENVGMYDMSSFGKLRVEGPDATAFMNHIGGGQYDVPIGKIVYTQFLNDRGGIEADVTVTRISETAYLVVTPAATRLADQTWMQRHVGDMRVVITDVTAGEGVLAVMGPNARKLLQAVSPADFSNEVNPFGTAQEIEIGMGLARVHRVTYVGELGWEVYVSADMAGHVFETLHEAGQNMGLKLCGMHMMDCGRIEKGFRHFGHDITCEDHVLEAGLGFAVKTDKPSFIGRDAVLRKKESGLENRLVQFMLNDPEPLLYHNEPILRDGEIVGYLSSGAYGHHLGAAIGLGYVPCKGESAADVLASSYEIDVCGTRVAAQASLKPLYDPKSERVRA
ncbi:MAG: glycine cleavage T C-terminal barrel domain-containing protein, partial [Pseudomonadota bacterium]